MLFLFFLAYVLLSYVHPGEIFASLAPYRIAYWTGLIGLVLAILSLLAKRSSPVRTVQFWFLGVFTLVMALSRMVNEHYLGAIRPTLNTFGPSLTMFVLAVCAVDSIRKLRVTAAAVCVLSLVLVLQGAAAYHFGYQRALFLLDPTVMGESAIRDTVSDEQKTDEEQIAADENDVEGEEEGWGTQVRIRGLGLLHDPNDLAEALLFGLPLFALAWKSGSRLRNALVVVIPMAAIVYGVFLTHSRGGTIALLLTLGLALSKRLGKIPAAVLLVVLAGGAVAANFAGGRRLIAADESAHGRVEAWSEGLQMLKQQPLLGVGYGQFTDHHDLTAHNSFVLCFAETGVIGYFFWLGMLVITFLQLRVVANAPVRDDTDARISRWARLLQLSMVGFITGAFFLSRTYVPILYLLVGLAIALVLIARDAGRPVWSPSLPQLGGLVLTSEVGSIALIYFAVKLHVV